MYIGLGIFLLVIGGILRYAVSVDIPGISVHGIGGRPLATWTSARGSIRPIRTAPTGADLAQRG